MLKVPVSAINALKWERRTSTCEREKGTLTHEKVPLESKQTRLLLNFQPPYYDTLQANIASLFSFF